MKKNEDQAAKKKPKTSAAEIRVQKGVCHQSRLYIRLSMNVELPRTARSYRARPTLHYGNQIRESGGSP